MTKLSVNINKVATIRNARGGKIPDVRQFAIDCQRFGADGITIHPRPDERHITTEDVYAIQSVIVTEYNIEGYPDERFIRLIEEIKPTQVTLVPDPPGVLTSNAGWNTILHKDKLKDICQDFKSLGIRTSIFIETNLSLLDAAVETGVDRIEFYTGPYANDFSSNPSKAVSNYQKACEHAINVGLGINAGHDLNLQNLRFFKQNLIQIDEVSIGHALISDALYLGLENTIQRYKYELRD